MRHTIDQDALSAVQSAQYLDAALHNAGTGIRHREPPRAMVHPRAPVGLCLLLTLGLICVVWGIDWLGRATPPWAKVVSATVLSIRDETCTVIAPYDGVQYSGKLPASDLAQPSPGDTLELRVDPLSLRLGWARFFPVSHAPAFYGEGAALAAAWLLLTAAGLRMVLCRRRRKAPVP